MAASASTAVVEVAAVMSDAMAYKIRREIVTGKFKSGREIDAVALDSKRSQLAAWEAVRGPGGARVAKWSREMKGIAKDVTETKEAAIAGENAAKAAEEAAIDARDRSDDVLNLLKGQDVGRAPGQTAKERLKEVRNIKTSLNNEAMDLREEEALRLRDLLGETPESKAAREARRGAKDAKVKDRNAAKDAKVKERDAAKDAKVKEREAAIVTKKANADEKKKAAEEKKKAAGEKRTKAADEKDRKRQKTDGLQQIDAKQTMLSFPVRCWAG
jgi:colicin import membrane protein